MKGVFCLPEALSHGAEEKPVWRGCEQMAESISEDRANEQTGGTYE